MCSRDQVPSRSSLKRMASVLRRKVLAHSLCSWLTRAWLLCADLNTISCNRSCHIPGHIPRLSTITKCECNITKQRQTSCVFVRKQLAIILHPLKVSFNICHSHFSHELYFYRSVCVPQETALNSYADYAQTMKDSPPPTIAQRLTC